MNKNDTTRVKKTPLAIAVRMAATGICASLTMAPFASSAQDEDTADKEKLLMEEVIVTGSRIPRAGFDTMQPAIAVDKSFLEAGAFTNIGDALNEMPMFGTATSSLDTPGDYAVGASFADFYGLGSQRTLTLVNGRRFVSSNPPTLFGENPGMQVDLNSIPTALIDRVEVISVGGAPIYGSDAIAGTVNIILKDNFEGVELDLQSGISDRGDVENNKVSLVIGNNFADGRGNAVLSLEHNKSKALLSRDRDFVNDYYYFFDNPEDTGPNDGIPDRIFGKNRVIPVLTDTGLPSPEPGLPLFAFDTNFFTDANGNPVTFGADGRLRPMEIGTPTSAINFIGGEGLKLQDYDSIRSPITRTLVNSLVHYDFTDNLRLFSEVSYYTADAKDPNNQPFFQSGIFGGNSAAMPISINNPYLSAADRQTLIDNGIDPADGEFYLHKAMTDLAGNKEDSSDNQLYRIVLGFEGDFQALNRNWNWDLSYNYGRSSATNSTIELVQANYEKAIDVTTDDDGNIVCRATIEEDDTSCVPLNLLGTNTDTAAMDYVTAQALVKSEIEQEIVSANIGGTLFDLPAGPLGIAFGYEQRRESSNFQPDAFLKNGLGRQAALSPLEGSFDTKEFYAEMLTPILSEGMVPLIGGLEIEGAFREVDHSSAGNDSTWSVGGRLTLDLPLIGTDLTLRGNITESIRSPSVTEVFLPTSSTFATASDPCHFSNVGKGPNPAARLAACQAEAAATGFAYDPTSFESFINSATQEGFKVGNPNLKNERADAVTYGLVYKSSHLEGLVVAIDWVEIDIEDAIQDLDLDAVMQACYDGGQLCENIIRDENFQVIDFYTGYKNAGFYNFRGVQMEADYGFTLQELVGMPGSFNLGVTGFHIKEQQLSVTGVDLDTDAGETGFSEWQWQGSLGYQLNDFSLRWQTRYIGEAVVDNEDSPESRDINPDNYWLHNATFSYNFTDTISARLVVRNVFDEEPPKGVNSFTAIGIYDIVGRYWTMGANIKF